MRLREAQRVEVRREGLGLDGHVESWLLHVGQAI